MADQDEGCTYSLRLANHFIVCKVLLGALHIQFGKPTHEKLNNAAILSVAILLFGTTIYGFASLQISMISLAVKMINHVSQIICFIDQKSESHEWSEQDKRSAFNYAVQQHQRCIRFVHCINKIFAMTTLLDVWTLTFALCLNTHLYVTHPSEAPLPVGSILLNVIVMALYIGMACWHSDRVTKAGLMISTNCNAMLWWNFDQDMIQDISIMSQVAQMKLTIKAGPVYTLNMRTFLAVLEICLTYFLILLKFS
ncbi:Hypothetical predicted protein [Cloeon dipterum]|uniref:Odorant receptor n=1 Tax=Cloeon dipterum TaxID=197152 RepID=A0A8S1D7M0_9INSE|nr:Hypothetical predicted protein [Cloeon dipterum]